MRRSARECNIAWIHYMPLSISRNVSWQLRQSDLLNSKASWAYLWFLYGQIWIFKLAGVFQRKRWSWTIGKVITSRVEGYSPPMTRESDVFCHSQWSRRNRASQITTSVLYTLQLDSRRMRVSSASALLLLGATASTAFSPLWRAPHHQGAITSTRPSPTFLSLSSEPNGEGNKTSASIKEEIVVEEESMEAEIAFGAFLDPNSNNNATTKKEASESPTTSTATLSDETSTTLWSQLLSIASRTGRGEFATSSDKANAMSLIQQLEQENPTPSPTNSSLMLGKWELVYSSTQLFRSSPFFMAGRAVCQDGDKAEQYDWFCDMHRQALAISNIGAVRQVVSNTTLLSEFEVKVGALPFLGAKWPFAYSGGLPVSTNDDDAVACMLLVNCRTYSHSPIATVDDWRCYCKFSRYHSD